jgi:hypothetical protein
MHSPEAIAGRGRRPAMFFPKLIVKNLAPCPNKCAGHIKVVLDMAGGSRARVGEALQTE